MDPASKIRSYLAAIDMVNVARVELGITEKIPSFSDDDVRGVCRWIGSRAPDTITRDDDSLVFGKHGIDIMLFISLNVFPWFYEKYGLSQVN